MSQNSALSAHLPTPEQALACKGAAPRAVVRDRAIAVGGLTEALRLLPDGGPDLKSLILAAADGLDKITPHDPDDTVHVRNLKAVREAMDLIRAKETPAAWDMDQALRAICQAIFSSFEAPAPKRRDKPETSQATARQAVQRNKPPSAKATARLPDNVLDRSSAKAIYAARRKAAG